jgi:hypothetical protein
MDSDRVKTLSDIIARFLAYITFAKNRETKFIKYRTIFLLWYSWTWDMGYRYSRMGYV